MTAERTPLYDEHVRLGAQMTTFSGWTMPLQYTSIRDEHRAVREAVGLFDLSHMGELRIMDDALAQRVVTRDLRKLRTGRIQYALLCNDRGGIIDDVLVYGMADGDYFLVVNAGNQDRDFEWIRAQALKPSSAGAAQDDPVFNEGRDWTLIGVQGPRAPALVQRLTGSDLSAVKYYAFIEGRVADVPCVISRTGYTGEDGFEVFCGNHDAVRLWRALLDAGKPDGVQPAGLGARDTLRLEAGMRLYGNDMDAGTNPLEAGLEWTLNLDKDFIGRDAIVRAREHGLERSLVGLKMLDRSIPRHGYPVSADAQPVGTVTSGNVSFTLGYNIAMAYVPPALSEPGTSVAVEVRGTAAPAEVVPLPFYKRPHPK
ncbi:MAG TPA: glycine cleavage system aminomethyltransferase GcvT [Candidatus Dormibacteraeota bacterium]|nr:glycine cleavage system aminomethyltransferase GcvT [Candidatus Dormibacteraeota bacterium]